MMEKMSTDCKIYCKEFCWCILSSLPSTFTIRIDDDITVRWHTIPENIENIELFNRYSTQLLECILLVNNIGRSILIALVVAFFIAVFSSSFCLVVFAEFVQCSHFNF